MSLLISQLGLPYDYNCSSPVTNQRDSSCSSIGAGNFNDHDYVSLPPYVHNEGGHNYNGDGGGGVHQSMGYMGGGGGGNSGHNLPRSSARTPHRGGPGTGMSSAPNSRPSSRARTPTAKSRKNNGSSCKEPCVILIYFSESLRSYAKTFAIFSNS